MNNAMDRNQMNLRPAGAEALTSETTTEANSIFVLHRTAKSFREFTLQHIHFTFLQL